jgi:hypothetical protein
LNENNEDKKASGSISTGDIAGAGIIVGSNINTGSISIGDTRIPSRAKGVDGKIRRGIQKRRGS